MHFPVAIQVHGPDEVGAGLEHRQLLLQQQRVRAQVDELAPRDDALDDLVDLLVEKGLAAGDRHHRRAAFVHRLQAVLDGQPLVEDFFRIVDLAAAGAGQIAAEQRLKHQHQRIPLASQQMLLDDISANPDRLIQRHGHVAITP